VWDENPKYPVEDWQYEVSNGDTRLGYLEWWSSQAEQEEKPKPVTLEAIRSEWEWGLTPLCVMMLETDVVLVLLSDHVLNDNDKFHLHIFHIHRYFPCASGDWMVSADLQKGTLAQALRAIDTLYKVRYPKEDE
jgi:hypothetical protein